MFLRLLLAGMSPSMACTTMNVSLDAARLSLADARFRRRCADVPRVLTENVRAALYSKAIKGTVSAQTLWFKQDGDQKGQAEHEAPTGISQLLAEFEQLGLTLKSLNEGKDS